MVHFKRQKAFFLMSIPPASTVNPTTSAHAGVTKSLPSKNNSSQQNKRMTKTPVKRTSSPVTTHPPGKPVSKSTPPHTTSKSSPGNVPPKKPLVAPWAILTGGFVALATIGAYLRGNVEKAVKAEKAVHAKQGESTWKRWADCMNDFNDSMNDFADSVNDYADSMNDYAEYAASYNSERASSGYTPGTTRTTGRHKKANTYYSTSGYKRTYTYRPGYSSNRSSSSNYSAGSHQQKKRSEKEAAYKTLGLNVGATWDEIKKAFRSLANVHHPDKNMGKPAEEQKQLQEDFKKISVAYQLLKDEHA
jgi:hypothetical protein